MSGKIVNKFMELKERREKRLGSKLTLEKISIDTGIAYTTIMRWAKDQVVRYDDKILVALCEYFKVNLSKLIDYEK